jgi:ribosome maturation factor RimP
MIAKETIEGHLREILSGTDIFPVEVRVDNANRIRVYIDRDAGVSIDDCARVNRELEARIDRDREDFALEVSSPGLDTPFRVREQYLKNLGKSIVVHCKDGTKIRGILRHAGDKDLQLEVRATKKGEEQQLRNVDFDEIASTRLYLEF